MPRVPLTKGGRRRQREARAQHYRSVSGAAFADIWKRGLNAASESGAGTVKFLRTLQGLNELLGPGDQLKDVGHRRRGPRSTRLADFYPSAYLFAVNNYRLAQYLRRKNHPKFGGRNARPRPASAARLLIRNRTARGRRCLERAQLREKLRILRMVARTTRQALEHTKDPNEQALYQHLLREGGRGIRAFQERYAALRALDKHGK